MIIIIIIIIIIIMIIIYFKSKMWEAIAHSTEPEAHVKNAQLKQLGAKNSKMA